MNQKLNKTRNNLNKIVLTTGIALALLFFTGVRGVEKTTEPVENSLFMDEVLTKGSDF